MWFTKDDGIYALWITSDRLGWLAGTSGWEAGTSGAGAGTSGGAGAGTSGGGAGAGTSGGGAGAGTSGAGAGTSGAGAGAGTSGAGAGTSGWGAGISDKIAFSFDWNKSSEFGSPCTISKRSWAAANNETTMTGQMTVKTILPAIFNRLDKHF